MKPEKASAYNANKILKYLDRLEDFQRGNYVKPVIVDFDLTNICNHKCPRCSASANVDNATVSLDDAKRVVSEMKDAGMKSIIYAGGGEPSCNPDLEQIIKFTFEKGIRVAVNTNAQQLSDSLIKTIVNFCDWMRVSVDADGPEIFQQTHGMSGRAFSQVLDNIARLVKEKKESKSEIVIGTCYLIGPHTIPGIFNAAKLVKDLGVDNIRYRPFAKWENMTGFSNEEIQAMQEELRKASELSDDNFEVSYPEDRCQTIVKGRAIDYPECYAVHVVTTVSADLKIYPCCRVKYREEFCFGDLNKQSFQDIWFSENRIKAFKKIDIKRDCPNPCMYEKINEIMYSIKEPVKHEEFL